MQSKAALVPAIFGPHFHQNETIRVEHRFFNLLYEFEYVFPFMRPRLTLEQDVQLIILPVTMVRAYKIFRLTNASVDTIEAAKIIRY